MGAILTDLAPELLTRTIEDNLFSHLGFREYCRISRFLGGV
jgi:hypothetical protein